MIKLSKLAWVLAFFVAVLLGGVRFVEAVSFQGPPSDLPLPSDLPESARTSRVVGAGSCSASACHNGPWQSGPKRSEYATWIDADPHARAQTTLHEPRSRSILKNYRGLASTREARPDQDALCLACHQLPNPRLDPVAVAERFSAADGVSCESCHGGAKNWVAGHFSFAWKSLAASDKEARGFADTKNLLKRARICAACHVGKEGMEVNHDLIAAGHPRLRFELGAYLANYSARHWSLKDEKSRYPDFDERVWALGQLVSAQAALDLLALRADATTAVPDRPWPELAEFNCASCHHQLKPSTAQALVADVRGVAKPGLPVWGTWYFSGLRDLTRGLGDAQAAEIPRRLEELQERMRNPAANRADIAARARVLSAQLEAITVRMERLPHEPARSLALTHSLLKTGDQALDWESATQKYLGLRSLGQTMRDLDSDRTQPSGPDLPLLEKELTDLGKALDRSFPSGRESLGGSPDLYDKVAIRELFDRLKSGLR